MSAPAPAKCPNCAAPLVAGAAECASCGVIVAKLLAQREKERKEAETALLAPPPEAAPRNPWIGRGIAIFLVLAWMLGLYLYLADFLNGRYERARREGRLAPAEPRPLTPAPPSSPPGSPPSTF